MPQRPTDEAAFRRWYAAHAQASGLNPDPDAPQQLYDYRAAFRAGAQPDASGHWPSQFKMAGHPNEVVGGFNTRTGARVPGTAQASEQELVRLGWDPATAQRLSTMPQSRQTEVISIGGREVTVPVGLTPDQIRALAQQMSSPAVEVGGPPTLTEDVMIGNHLVKVPANASPEYIKALAAEIRKNPPPADDTFIGGGTVTDTHQASEGALRDNAPAWQKGLAGAWEYMNPIPMIKAIGDPIGTIKNIGLAQWDQAKKAYAAAERAKTETPYGGFLPLSQIEAMGHLGAAVLPIVGPAAADIGETFARGEYARGAGQLGGLLVGGKMMEAAPKVVLKTVKAAGAPSKAMAARNAILATQDVAEATNRAKYDAKSVAKQDRYTAAQQVHQQNIVNTENAARQLHAAEEAVYNAKTKATHDTARAQWEAKKAAYDAATDAQQRTAAAEHAAKVAAADETAAAKQQWVADRQAAADAHAQGVEQSVAGKLADMEPTNIVVDRRGPVPPGAPEGTLGDLYAQQFQKPSRATREAADRAAKLRLIQQTGGEVPRPQGGPVVPDLPLQPSASLPDFVPPARGPFPDFVPPASAPFEPFVPPAQRAFPAYVPEPAYVPLAQDVLPDFSGPKTRGGELAWKAAKYGGGGLLGYNVWQSLRDSFLK